MSSYEQIIQLSQDSRNLLLLFSKMGATTKEELVKVLGVSRTTLNRMLDPLIQCGAVLEIGEGDSSGGRKPLLFDVNPKQNYMVGIAITRYAVRIEFFDLCFRTNEHRRNFFMTPDHTPETVFNRIGVLFQELLDDIGITAADVIGVGVGVTGRYSQESQMLLAPGGFIAPGWLNVPINSMLEELLQVKVYVDELPNMVAEFYYHYLNEQGYSNLAYIGFGIRVQTSIIYKGELVQTTASGKDSFAHMTIIENGEFCSCGSRGCLERYVAIPHIVFNYNTLRKNGNPKLEGSEAFEQICQMADGGDPIAQSVIIDAATHFSVGLRNLARLFNIQMIVLNGAAMYSGELFFNTCRDLLLNDSTCCVERLKRDADGKWAMTRGAAASGFKYLIGEV